VWGDRVLCALGRAFARSWPGRRKSLERALARTRDSLSLDGSLESLWPQLAAGTARFLARDYFLDVPGDATVMPRFEVHGHEHLLKALEAGRGALLVGSHFGAHLAGLHWLFRSGIPVSAMVQRPPHISSVLSRLFDARLNQGKEHDLFLRRDLVPGEAAELLLRARTTLRNGHAVYVCGDIPWHGPNCRPGRLLGRNYDFLSIWTELAVLTRAPTFLVFCSHLPGGRFQLEIEAIGQVHQGEEDLAVADFMRQLEARIANDPTQAVAHLLWPCFNPPAGPVECSLRMSRPSRRSHTLSRPTQRRPGRIPMPVQPSSSAGSPFSSR
jgi:lauroyl/myristoyl acyltransferase